MLKKWSRINSYSCDANRELQTVISPKLIKIFSFCFVLLIFSCTFMWTQKYSINKQLILCAGTYYKAQASPLLDLLVPPIIVPKSVTSHLKQLIMVKDINHILPLIVSLICGVFKSTVTGEMVFFFIEEVQSVWTFYLSFHHLPATHVYKTLKSHEVVVGHTFPNVYCLYY